jgi:hypothetical protein
VGSQVIRKSEAKEVEEVGMKTGAPGAILTSSTSDFFDF